jgi:hypothetical protein
MIPEAARLRQALVDAYAAFVQTQVERHLPGGVDGLDETIGRGRAWLEAELTNLLERPFDAQRRGPLECFQEALRFPTEALAEAGVAAPPRDPVMVSALPGDLFDLAPASSRALGEEVWAAHMAWGVAKARSMGGGKI